MSDLEKVIAQMRQYVHENDGEHECRASGYTLTSWANTLERLTQQTSQGPTGEASSGESGVQSAADVIAELRARANAEREAGLAQMAKHAQGTIFHYSQYCYVYAFREMLQWLDELSRSDQKPMEHEAKCVAAD
jgi:hypothetical protein